MSEIVPFPGAHSSGTGGPDDPTLLQRVGRLEEDMKDAKSTLRGIETKLGSIEVALARIDGRLAGLEGRLQQIPTVWQTVSILAVLLFGVAGVIFAAGNFLRP